MKKLLTWFWLLTKRLYKKPTFLVILVLIPLLIFGYQGMAQGDSGIVTILLTQEGNDPIANEIMDDLCREHKLFRYQKCATPEEASLLVQTGKADAAWIFPEDMAGHLEAFLEKDTNQKPFIKIYQQEKNLSLMLARERLSGAVYHHLAQRFYLQYTREEFPELADLSDEELMVYYDNIQMSNNLFTYENVNKQQVSEVHYLVAPVRGLLAIVIVLCGLATALYYIKDSRNGTFDWIPQRLRPISELGCQAVSVLNMGVAALLALLLTKLHGNLLLEIPTLLLYTFCVGAFCMLLRSVFRQVKALGSLIPPLIVAMLLMCPVFFDLPSMRAWQFLLPPTYYINAVYNPMYLLYMSVYTVVCFGLYLLSEALQKHTK